MSADDCSRATWTLAREAGRGREYETDAFNLNTLQVAHRSQWGIYDDIYMRVCFQSRYMAEDI